MGLVDFAEPDFSREFYRWILLDEVNQAIFYIKQLYIGYCRRNCFNLYREYEMIINCLALFYNCIVH